ncbi:hypothetical protein HYE68_006726 [Fusarium pseudograminearum]|nr:hypothetical protein HYE68_006726 [Fusarium pseudograminearum]
MAGSKRPAPVPQNVLRWNNSKWRSGPSQHQPTGAVGVPTLLQYIQSCRRIPTSLELQMGKHWILFLLLFTDFSALRHYRQLHGPDVGTSIGKITSEDIVGSIFIVTLCRSSCKEKLRHIHNTGMAVEDWAYQLSLNMVCLIRGNAFFVSRQP